VVEIKKNVVQMTLIIIILLIMFVEMIIKTLTIISEEKL